MLTTKNLVERLKLESEDYNNYLLSLSEELNEEISFDESLGKESSFTEKQTSILLLKKVIDDMHIEVNSSNEMGMLFRGLLDAISDVIAIDYYGNRRDTLTDSDRIAQLQKQVNKHEQVIKQLKDLISFIETKGQKAIFR